MKSFALATALIFVTGVAFADPVEGIWQTNKDDSGTYGYVQIKPCGPAFCGILIQSFKEDGTEYQSENLGKQIVINMVPAGDGNYDGEVWRPSNNKIYVGGIEINGDSMKLAGCVMGGLFCLKKTWNRVN